MYRAGWGRARKTFVTSIREPILDESILTIKVTVLPQELLLISLWRR
jgi:hypothetical protein